MLIDNFESNNIFIAFITAAQELLNDWMNSKLKLELASDEDNDVQNSAPISVPLQDPVAGFQKYKKFDGASDFKFILSIPIIPKILLVHYYNSKYW